LAKDIIISHFHLLGIEHRLHANIMATFASQQRPWFWIRCTEHGEEITSIELMKLFNCI